MKNRSLSFAVLTCLAMLAGSLSAYAQSSKTVTVTQVPFAFVVGDKTMPAGSYRIVHQVQGMPQLVIQGGAKNDNMVVPIETRLARPEGQGRAVKPTLVFDEAAGQHYLSEVWVPGQDGFLVRGTKEAHTHAVVDSAESKDAEPGK